MNSERWQQIEKIFQAAVDLAPSERAAFLDVHCRGNEDMRRNVEALLVSDEQGCELLETPAFETAASLLAEAPPQLTAGQTLGHYQIESLLGVGGMGEVYLAEDAKLRRKAALKLLPLFFSTDNQRVQQFEQEAFAASALNHPNIITIYEIDEFENRPFLATEFIDGETLRQRMGRGKLELSEILDIAIQVASALEASHRAGIIHRDIKPENIMLRRDGYVKVLDFGLAKLTELQGDAANPEALDLPSSAATTSSRLMGTVRYMSPEQANGWATDARSDLFSLGVVMYEMIAGHPPFQGETSDEILAAIRNTEPRSLNELQPDLPNEAQRIIAKTLVKDKEARYQSAEECLKDLKRLQKELDLVSGDISQVKASGKLVESQIEAEKDAASEFGMPASRRKISKFTTLERLSKVKKRHIALIALIVLALAIPAALWLRKYYFQLNAAKLGFQQRDWVLITAFDNQTGESLFNGTLEYAMEREVSNSDFVNIVPRERVEDALKLMKKPTDAKVDATLGKEICLRDGGIRALLAGRVEKLSGVYILTARLIDPALGVTVASSSEDAKGEEQISLAVRQLANWARKALGEKLVSIRQSTEAMEKVTTPSLQALQLYTQGEALLRQDKQAVAAPIFRQALTEDPEFASAYIMLAWSLRNQDKPENEWKPASDRAMVLSERVSERERYFIQGSYYSMQQQDDKAAPIYEALLERYPDHYWGRNNLQRVYERLRRYPEWLSHFRQLADQRPNDWELQILTANYLLLTTNQTEAAFQYAKRAKELLTPEDTIRNPNGVAYTQFFLMAEPFMQGDLETTLAELERVAQTIEARSGRERDAFAHYTSHFGYVRFGKLKAAEEIAQKESPDRLRYYDLACLAFSRNDRNSLRNNLLKYLHDSKVHIPGAILLLIRAGLLAEAEKLMADPVLRNNSYGLKDENFLKVCQGEMAFARGQTAKAISLLLQAISALKDGDRVNYVFYYAAWDSLATIYEHQGDVSALLHALEDGSDPGLQERVFINTGRLYWLPIRARLAQLYRKLGRIEQAQKVEEELLSQLKYADADHPVLLQIQKARKQ